MNLLFFLVLHWMLQLTVLFSLYQLIILSHFLPNHLIIFSVLKNSSSSLVSLHDHNQNSDFVCWPKLTAAMAWAVSPSRNKAAYHSTISVATSLHMRFTWYVNSASIPFYHTLRLKDKRMPRYCTLAYYASRIELRNIEHNAKWNINCSSVWSASVVKGPLHHCAL
jgi:hypothetical protein